MTDLGKAALTQVEYLQGINPVASYSTVTDLRAAYPNGTVGLFSVIADSGLYKWDKDMLMWINIVGVTDVLPFTTTTVGYYVNSTGVYSALASFAVTDYINVSKFKKMILIDNNNYTPSVVFFDGNKNFLSGLNVNGTNTNADIFIEIPLTAVYARVNFNKDYVSTSYVKLIAGERNILPSIPVVNNYYIDSSHSLVANASLAVTDYFDVSTVKSFIIKNALFTPLVTFWDSSRNYLSSVNGTASTGDIKIIVPSNAKYARVNFSVSAVASSYIKVNYKSNIGAALFKSNTASGLYMTCIGDSLTAFNKWQATVVNRLKLKGYEILAQAGGQLTTGMYPYISNINPASDIITIWGGTNDWSFGAIDLGDFSSPVVGGSTYCGTLRYMVEQIINAYPTMKVFLITPAQRYTNSYTYNSVTYTGAPDSPLLDGSNIPITDSKGQYKNSRGNTLEDYVNTMKDVGAFYSIPVVDLYHAGYVNSKNYATYYRGDGIHHSDVGGQMHGKIIANAIGSYV